MNNLLLNNEIEQVKQKMKKYFKFEIPIYILHDIVVRESYYHFCLMINIAVVCNKIDRKDAEILKNRTRQMFNITTIYDRVIIN